MLAPAFITISGDWLDSAAVRSVMAALNTDSAPQALFVGGCVRDALLLRPAGDIDIATVHAPAEATRLLEAANIRVVPTGIAHGTVTAVIDKKPFQITTLRKDVETFGRHAVVAFTDDWRADARRRDFTMNTLLADLEGNVYDPLGRGLDDLRSGRVIFVGDPETRVTEDYLRILRFFRFHAAYGRGEPDSAALKACRRLAGHIAGLSRERITMEFTRILAGDNPVDIIKTMLFCNVLSEIIHPQYQSDILDRLVILQKQAGKVDVSGRLAVLAGFKSSHIPVFEKRLIFSARELSALAASLDALQAFDRISEKSVRQLVYHYGNDNALSVVLLKAAQEKTDVASTLIDMAAQWQGPSFPLSGNDMKDLGMREGPAMGRILKIVENWWLDEDFIPDRNACIQKTLSLLQSPD